MVLGERVFQGATLLFIENQHWVVQNWWTLSDLTESIGELAELRAMVRRQGEMISLLTDHVMRPEGIVEGVLGDSSGQSLGSSIYGSAWSSSGTRDSPIVECWVQVNFLEPMSSSEGEREAHVVENTKPVLVRAPTPVQVVLP